MGANIECPVPAQAAPFGQYRVRRLAQVAGIERTGVRCG
jgi:hypothetical protein